MFVPQDTLVTGHLGTEVCRRGAEQKRHCLAANAAWVATGRDLWDRDQILEKLDILYG